MLLAILYNFTSHFVEVANMNRIRALREGKSWRQSDLAALLNTAPQTVGRYENGDRDIDSATICRLCEIFGCTADYLLCRSELPSPELSPEEAALLLAFRRADDRARDMVLLALAPFREEEAAGRAI